jgi:hypothetical protein
MASELIFIAMKCEKMAAPFVLETIMTERGAPNVIHTKYFRLTMKGSKLLATLGAPTPFESKSAASLSVMAPQ